MFITPNGLHFHHENVLRQDPLLKPNHANITEVPRSCETIVVPKALPNLIITDRELAMEISRGQKFVQAGSTGKSFRSDQFFPDQGSERDTGCVSNLARRSPLRGRIMYNSSDKISAMMSLYNSPVEIQKNSIQFPMETEFCESFPELEDHFEISEHIRGFDVTIVTPANTRDETLPSRSGFLQKDEGDH